MEHIKYFLKFGEEEHLKELAKGILYCSTAEMFWSIENEKKIKGQGDILEARTKFHVQNVAVRSHNSSENATFNTNNFMITCDQAAHMPVFCLFSVYEDDCDIDEKGRLIINLPENKKKYIIDHFPEANAVAIITNPVRFLDDVVRSIGCDVKHEEMHYFLIRAFRSMAVIRNRWMGNTLSTSCRILLRILKKEIKFTNLMLPMRIERFFVKMSFLDTNRNIELFFQMKQYLADINIRYI